MSSNWTTCSLIRTIELSSVFTVWEEDYHLQAEKEKIKIIIIWKKSVSHHQLHYSQSSFRRRQQNQSIQFLNSKIHMHWYKLTIKTQTKTHRKADESCHSLVTGKNIKILCIKIKHIFCKLSISTKTFPESLDLISYVENKLLKICLIFLLYAFR